VLARHAATLEVAADRPPGIAFLSACHKLSHPGTLARTAEVPELLRLADL
jgi:hypothetical protein